MKSVCDSWCLNIVLAVAYETTSEEAIQAPRHPYNTPCALHSSTNRPSRVISVDQSPDSTTRPSSRTQKMSTFRIVESRCVICTIVMSSRSVSMASWIRRSFSSRDCLSPRRAVRRPAGAEAHALRRGVVVLLPTLARRFNAAVVRPCGGYANMNGCWVAIALKQQLSRQCLCETGRGRNVRACYSHCPY